MDNPKVARTPTKDKYEYPVHPVADLFPTMAREEFERLKRDIKINGQAEPIVLSTRHRKDEQGKSDMWDKYDILLDGRNRLKACKELEIEPLITYFDGSSADYGAGDNRIRSQDEIESDYIWAKNVLRRHLTADQRAILAAEFADTMKKIAKERSAQNLKRGDKTPELADSPTRGKTREALAKMAETSTHKIRQTEEVKKHPELTQQVKTGEMKLKDAVKQAQPQPPPPQPKVRKSDFDQLGFAVNAAIKQVEKIVAEGRRHVPQNELEVYDDAIATRLEHLAKTVRGRTADPIIDITEERIQ
jgi:ParB-like chromosome segregation protein Spo0J